MSARQGGRIKINIDGQQFNLRKYENDTHYQSMYSKYKADFTPMIIVQDFPESELY